MPRRYDNQAREGVRTLSLLFAIFLLASMSSLVYAQSGGVDVDPGDPGTGGKNSIQGHIYYPSGRTVDKRFNVTLTSISTGPKMILADDNGEFIFRRLMPGTYTVTVNAGKDFETVSETVYIIDSPTMRTAMGRNFTVQIRLKYKAGGSVKPDVLDASLANVPQPALKLYQKAQASAHDGDTRKAIKHLEDAVALYPQFVMALSELGFQYLRLNELDKAADALERAIKLVPEAFDPHLNYGRLLIQQKKFTEAEAELKIALKINDSSALVHFHLARALLGQNLFDAAETELKRTITLSNDGISEAHRFLGAIYNQRGDAKQAVAELEAYLRLAPDTKDASQIRNIIKQLRAQQAAKDK